MKTINCLLLFLFFATTSILAQETVITGKVTTGTDQTPLQGVNVSATTGNGKIQSVSNAQGIYNIRVPASVKELTFTYVGMAPFTQKLNGQPVVNIQLEGSNSQLDQVVVTALGIRREAKALSYSRQKMDITNITEAPSTNIVSSLSGKVAGVQITPPSSTTGSARIIIRGTNSITGNNQPLFVIDGIPVDNEAGDKTLSTSGNNNLDYGNAAANINPEDIENIEILKGPNASALYGSRAANGVVLITTKKSSGKRFKVTFNSNMSFQRITEFPEYQNVFGAGAAYKLEGSGSTSNPARIPNERVFNTSWGAPLLGQPVYGINGQLKAYLPEPDNILDFYQTAGMITNAIALEGGNAQNSYRFSYTNYYGNSVVAGINKNTRNTINLRVTNNVADWFNLDSKITFSRNTVTNRQYMNGSTKNPIYQYAFMVRDVRFSDYAVYKDSLGNETNTHTSFLNPYWAINENPNQDTRDQFLGAFNANISFNRWLKLTARLGTEMTWTDGYEFNNKGAQSDADGLLKTFNNKLNNINADVILTATKKFGNISLNTFVGAGRFQSVTQKRGAQINSLIQAGLINISNSSESPTATDFVTKKAINSVYVSVSFGYKNYLFLDVTARNDWSSTLPIQNNSYFYPSIGGSFVFTDAFKTIPRNILSFGKIRASYAIVGSDTDPYQLEPTYSFNGIYNGQAYASLSSTFFNPDLKPEKTASAEGGVDLRFLNDKLTLSYTYYKSSTTNQIITAQITPASGYQTRYYNAGQIDNWGHEIVLGATPVQNKKFSWNVLVNFAKNRSKVVSLIDGVNAFLLNTWFGNANVYAEVGQPYGIIRGRGWKRDSLNRKLVAPDGGVLTTPNTLLGSALPNWTSGITNNFKVGNFTFSFLIDIRNGGSFYSGTYKRELQSGAFAFTLTGREDYYLHTYILGEDPNLTNTGFIFSDAYFENGKPNDKYLNPDNAIKGKGYFNNEELEMFDASYVKLREIVVGYNLPASLLKKLPLSSARISLSGRNLWTIHKNTPAGIDPEASVTSGNGQGIEYGSLPPSSTYGFNLILTF
ncbi:MAG: TonB-dependent receptor plug [Chitinophagaceae bacterium]|nr:TonB-dependent receptor plug [Chitinophagaceae bacterium]